MSEKSPSVERAALFQRDGNTWIPQQASVGPWSSQALHGGPVAALVVSLVEEILPDERLVTTRMTLDLVRPVPTRPLTARCEIVKSGRRVNLADVELADASGAVALARIQRTAVEQLTLPPISASGWKLVPPEDTPEDFTPIKFARAPFALLASDIRTRHPDGFFSGQPTEAWIRVHADLTPGVPLSPAAAVVAAADYGNALGAPLPPGESLAFPNADLSVHLARRPVSNWVRMSPATTWQEHAIGHTRCDLSDTLGMLGTSAVTLALAMMRRA